MENILQLFHHLHHNKGKHEVHHCGGVHQKVNAKLNYRIRHCRCGLHNINKRVAIGHATSNKLNNIEVKIKFKEKCPAGGWHIESGKIEK